ncbi:MAG: hypothetical protein ACRCXT_00650 [Paraclostridium sp.]
MISYEDFEKAIIKNNEFIRAEKRRQKIWSKKQIEHQANNFKSDCVNKMFKTDNLRRLK